MRAYMRMMVARNAVHNWLILPRGIPQRCAQVQVSRDKPTIKLRIASNLQSAIVFGTIWWRLRRIQAAIASRMGMLQVRAPFCSQRLSEGTLFVDRLRSTVLLAPKDVLPR